MFAACARVRETFTPFEEGLRIEMTGACLREHHALEQLEKAEAALKKAKADLADAKRVYADAAESFHQTPGGQRHLAANLADYKATAA